MSKRSASPSPPLSPEAVAVKKQKMESGSVETYAPSPASPATNSAPVESPEVDSNETDLPEAESTEAGLPEADSSEMNETKAQATKTTPKTQKKRKAGEGFIAWTPPRAREPLPELQPHWGIVPRRGGYERPSEPQPPARDSDGGVRPPLWEDRKGAVRVKRGSRIVDGYDQADHLWLPLMDVRPVSAKNQTPRRKVIGYWYPHGMPADWNDATVLNDANKALQEAIKSNSNKEAPFNPAERQTLASIFAEHPDISLLDAAELFNERAHPVTGSEEGSYPTGRFTESIQHEFRSYQSVYLRGEVPTASTLRESALDDHYQIWKAEQEQAKTDAATAKKDAKAAAKAEKQAAKEAKAKAAAEKKEAREKAKAEKTAGKKTKKPAAKKGEKKMSDTAGVTKKKKRADEQPYSSKIPFTLEEMMARAEATGQIIEERAAAEEAAAEMGDSAGETKKLSPRSTRIRDDEEMVARAAEIMKKNAAEKAAKEAAKLAVKAAREADKETAEKEAAEKEAAEKEAAEKEAAEKEAAEKEAAEKEAKEAAKLAVKAAREASKLAEKNARLAEKDAMEVARVAEKNAKLAEKDAMEVARRAKKIANEAEKLAAETPDDAPTGYFTTTRTTPTGSFTETRSFRSTPTTRTGPNSWMRSFTSTRTSSTSTGPLTQTFTSTGPFTETFTKYGPFSNYGPFGENGPFGNNGPFGENGPLNATRLIELDEDYDEEEYDDEERDYDEEWDYYNEERDYDDYDEERDSDEERNYDGEDEEDVDF
jgi:hypothetical protein